MMSFKQIETAGFMSEADVRKLFVRLGLDVIHTLTKRSIEERVRSELKVSKLELSRSELIDIATDVAKELEHKREPVSEESDSEPQPVKKQKKEEKKARKKEEEEEKDEGVVGEESGKKNKKKAKTKKKGEESTRKGKTAQQHEEEEEVDWARREREAQAAQRGGAWTLGAWLAAASGAPRPQLFCRRCGSLLPAPSAASARHLQCVVCK